MWMVSLAFTKTFSSKFVANFLVEGKFVCAGGCALILVGHERQSVLKSDSKAKIMVGK
jgi:hypothetical protein